MSHPWSQHWISRPLAGGVGITAALLLAEPAWGQQAALASPPAARAASPMDGPLQLLADAKASYARVTDYSCLFIKQEQVAGRLQEQNVISMQVRVQPFSVYLLWLLPRQFKGQEACYVAGKNGGQMRIHATGLRGAVGFVSIDPNDPRVQQSSRHSITDAGIGHLIEVYGQRWPQEKGLGLTQVRIADYDYAKRKCTRVEMIHPQDNRFLFFRSVVYFDKETHLPIRVENYDWPRPGSMPAGNLVESYSYVQMRINTGLTDAVFNH